MIRSLWVLVAGAVLTTLYASRVVLSAWSRRADMPCVCDQMARRWARLVLRLAGVRLKTSDLDRFDWSKPAVVVANHQSWFDVFALLAALPGRGRFVAKEELSRIPIFGLAWRICGHISVNRADRKQAIASLDRAAERVRDESLTMILFPEGTRSPDGRLHAFKKGAFVLAIKTGVPVVPVGISGSRPVMPKGSFKVRGGEIRVRVGEPIEVARNQLEERDRLRTQARAAVAKLMEGELAEVGPNEDVAASEADPEPSPASTRIEKPDADDRLGAVPEESTIDQLKETQG